ncbi:hypothetical protein BRARA_I00006 [Brassica rapa]|uniref:RING-type E3 ubiquitin transferase n=1 Tax=Brassica campestris TaxID=3711 RepID=A0A397XPK0_BRACM|nr:hypothetical protein BRARA_I00006 [Brassica rapa]
MQGESSGLPVSFSYGDELVEARKKLLSKPSPELFRPPRFLASGGGNKNLRRHLSSQRDACLSVLFVVGDKMGGCCSSASSSSRHSHLVGAPLYYYCPESFEELGPSGARAGGVGSAALTPTGHLLADIIGLETSSIPNTFYAPAPLPYDLLFGRPDSKSIKGNMISDCSFETCEDLRGPDCKTQPASVILSPSETDRSKHKTWKNQLVDEEEEESCPICFEDYEADNPKIKTNCEHDFHLSCILEWMEKSDGCPICDKEVVFDDCLN